MFNKVARTVRWLGLAAKITVGWPLLHGSNNKKNSSFGATSQSGKKQYGT
jgi:hypothetical protein